MSSDLAVTLLLCKVRQLFQYQLVFYGSSSLLPWYSRDILLISRHGRGLPAQYNPPILCMSFQTNILLSGCSYLVNNPCFNAGVKSGLLHQLYYPIFILGRYGRVVTVFPPGKAKLSCLYSAHNLPVLSITCILAYAPNLPEVRILGISPKCSKFGLNSGFSSKN